jgi:hypothetical protein
MTKPLIQIDDEVREMTDAELAIYQLSIDEENAKKAELEAKADAKAALLERLGITADEAALLLG